MSVSAAVPPVGREGALQAWNDQPPVFVFSPQKGQNLEPFIQSFFNSCESPRAKPSRPELTVLSPSADANKRVGTRARCRSRYARRRDVILPVRLHPQLLNRIYRKDASVAAEAGRPDQRGERSAEVGLDGTYDYLMHTGGLPPCRAPKLAAKRPPASWSFDCRSAAVPHAALAGWLAVGDQDPPEEHLGGLRGAPRARQGGRHPARAPPRLAHHAATRSRGTADDRLHDAGMSSPRDWGGFRHLRTSSAHRPPFPRRQPFLTAPCSPQTPSSTKARRSAAAWPRRREPSGHWRR